MINLNPFCPSLHRRISRAARVIWKKAACCPEVAIVLGTGLGNLAKEIKKDAVIPYDVIPYFPKATTIGHAGRLVFGTIGVKKVVIMDGRFHCYEGYSMEQVTFPIRVLRKLGAKILIVSNAAGGLNLDYQKGDLVLIVDHINFMGDNPLIGTNDDRLGIRFPDMSEPYSRELLKLAEKEAEKNKIPVRRGVYLGVTGPCLETKAEYRFMRNLGADLVGMSTVPEAIVGVHAGFQTLGISIVTDVCDPEHLEPVQTEQIIRTANQAGPKLDSLIDSFIHELPHHAH